jgi:hypothetical protein
MDAGVSASHFVCFTAVSRSSSVARSCNPISRLGKEIAGDISRADSAHLRGSRVVCGSGSFSRVAPFPLFIAHLRPSPHGLRADLQGSIGRSHLSTMTVYGRPVVLLHFEFRCSSCPHQHHESRCLLKHAEDP